MIMAVYEYQLNPLLDEIYVIYYTRQYFALSRSYANQK